MKYLPIIFLMIFHVNGLTYAGIETPYISSFSKLDYGAAGQNWSVSTDTKGKVYFGNSKGLLKYNGNTWKLYPMPGNNYVRSVKCSPDGRIYVGSFEEFGYYEQDIYGELKYTSISALLNEYAFHNDEIWSIVLFNDKVYFRSFSTYFVYDGKTVVAKGSPLIFRLLTRVDDTLYAYFQQHGLCVLEGNDFKLLIPENRLNGDNAIAVLPYKKGKIIIPTAKSGLFLFDGENCIPWQNEANNDLKNATINHAAMTRDSLYIFGTITDGVYSLDKSGNLEWKINSSNKLSNNTVLGLVCGESNNIWLALDNGIAYIKCNSMFSFINSFKQDIGSVYSAAFKDNQLYLATNQGLFFNNLEDNQAHLIPNTSEQAWDLSVIDGQLICGHNSGTYEITGQKTIKMSDVQGATCIRRAYINQQEVLVQSTYTFLSIYKKNEANKWAFSHIVENFMEPIRYIEVDMMGNIWASHFYKGLYKVKLSPDLREAESVEVFPSLNKNTSNGEIFVFNLSGRILFKDYLGYYTYDDLSGSIKPFKKFDDFPILKNNITKIFPMPDNTCWFVGKNEFIQANLYENNIEIKRHVPFRRLYGSMPDNNENVIFIKEGKYLFCLDNGIALMDEKIHFLPDTVYEKIEIESIQASGKKQMKKLPVLAAGIKQIINFTYNTLTFEVSYPHPPTTNVGYKYKLSGTEEEYSAPSDDFIKTYNKLSPGNYTFEATAIDSMGRELSSISYGFEIEPPFYASNLALILYVILVVIILFTLWFRIKRYIHKSKERIEHEQNILRQKEKEKQEQEIIRLRNEKLEADLTFKSKELAGSTMSIIKKNEVLSEIKSELLLQKDKLGAQFPNKYYDKLIRLIEINLSSEDDWQIFQTNFDRIHENFFRHLKLTYPDLTPNDLKLCALLRLNMNTKDIANLMNITIRGVEVARYRLRKKLDLPSEKNLVDFMIEFK